jgi:hypothetical protein
MLGSKHVGTHAHCGQGVLMQLRCARSGQATGPAVSTVGRGVVLCNLWLLGAWLAHVDTTECWLVKGGMGCWACCVALNLGLEGTLCFSAEVHCTEPPVYAAFLSARAARHAVLQPTSLAAATCNAVHVWLMVLQ